jgi:ribosome-associated protein
VSTKVELLFKVLNSEFLSDRKKKIISEKLSNRINSEGLLILKCDETRSQLTNKEIVWERFIQLIKTALIPNKIRRATKPSRAAVRKRLDTKKKQAQKKSNRRYRGE